MWSGLIEAIIKANKNLTDSNNHNDWEMMGKDIKRLQDLINSLDVVKQEEDKKKIENKDKEVSSEKENSTNDTNKSNINEIE